MRQSLQCHADSPSTSRPVPSTTRCPPCVAHRQQSGARMKRRHTIILQSQSGGGGLLSGLGKLFQGGSKSVQEAPQESTEKAAPQEVFMNGSSNEQPEFPPFQVVSRAQDYVLRFYEVYPVVEMEYEQRQEGYAALGSFIDGDNQGGVRFKYTQPVTMKYEGSGGGSKVMQMFLGSKRAGADSGSMSVAALPAPRDPAVRVSIAGGELIAVSQFEGYITPGAAEGARQQLVAALKRDGVRLSEEAEAGAFRVGQFGAVYQLAGRINEMYIKVVLS